MLSEKPRGGLSETRKMTKSTMEKKRRARINNSLTELKAILSGMISNKGERFDKMEKADILEMTVKCVRQLQKQANTGEPVSLTRNPVDEDYRSGMHTCMSELIKFISSSNFSDADPEIKTKLLNHLANKLNSGTTQRENMDQEIPYSNPNPFAPENNTTVPNLKNIDADSFSISDVSNDSNNNLQTINDKNTPLSVSVQPKSPSPVPSMASPLFSYRPIQPVHETPQQQQQQTSVPTVPLTILVPANICSATLGTTCVIPFNLPTTSPQFNQASVLPTASPPFSQASVLPTASPPLNQASVLQTASPPSQTSFTINSSHGISLIQTPHFVQNTQMPSKVHDFSNLSPQNRLYTFTPTVLSNCIQTQNLNCKTVPATVPFTTMLHTKDGSDESTNLNHTTIATKEPISNYQRPSKPKEVSSTQLIEFPRMTPQKVPDSNKIFAESIKLKCSFADPNTNAIREQNEEKGHQDRRRSEELLRETDRPVQFKHGQNSGIRPNAEKRSFVNNRNHDNGCDNVSDMWRPWKSAI